MCCKDYISEFPRNCPKGFLCNMGAPESVICRKYRNLMKHSPCTRMKKVFKSFDILRLTDKSYLRLDRLPVPFYTPKSIPTILVNFDIVKVYIPAIFGMGISYSESVNPYKVSKRPIKRVAYAN